MSVLCGFMQNSVILGQSVLMAHRLQFDLFNRRFWKVLKAALQNTGCCAKGWCDRDKFLKRWVETTKISDLVIKILDVTHPWNQGLVLSSHLIFGMQFGMLRNCERSGCPSGRCHGYRKVCWSLHMPVSRWRKGAQARQLLQPLG